MAFLAPINPFLLLPSDGSFGICNWHIEIARYSSSPSSMFVEANAFWACSICSHERILASIPLNDLLMIAVEMQKQNPLCKSSGPSIQDSEAKVQ